jgi:hypothetical protein
VARRTSRGIPPYPESASANLAANFADLLSKILFHYSLPNTPALTILVRTFFKESQLLAPLSDQGVESE